MTMSSAYKCVNEFPLSTIYNINSITIYIYYVYLYFFLIPVDEELLKITQEIYNAAWQKLWSA